MLFSTVIVTVVIVFLIVWKINHRPKNTNATVVRSSVPQIKQTENYITPTEFEVGLIKDKPCQFANNCTPNVLYPINGLGVDYGSKMPDGCPCAQFIQSP